MPQIPDYMNEVPAEDFDSAELRRPLIFLGDNPSESVVQRIIENHTKKALEEQPSTIKTLATSSSAVSPSLSAILEERGAAYGPFHNHANITQELERVVRLQLDNSLISRVRQEVMSEPMADAIREAIHMIFHKVGRVVNGNPLHKDSWDDIAGYATLVANLIKDQSK